MRSLSVIIRWTYGQCPEHLRLTRCMSGSGPAVNQVHRTSTDANWASTRKGTPQFRTKRKPAHGYCTSSGRLFPANVLKCYENRKLNLFVYLFLMPLVMTDCTRKDFLYIIFGFPLRHYQVWQTWTWYIHVDTVSSLSNLKYSRWQRECPSNLLGFFEMFKMDLKHKNGTELV